MSNPATSSSNIVFDNTLSSPTTSNSRFSQAFLPLDPQGFLSFISQQTTNSRVPFSHTHTLQPPLNYANTTTDSNNGDINNCNDPQNNHNNYSYHNSPNRNHIQNRSYESNNYRNMSNCTNHQDNPQEFQSKSPHLNDSNTQFPEKRSSKPHNQDEFLQQLSINSDAKTPSSSPGRDNPPILLDETFNLSPSSFPLIPTNSHSNRPTSSSGNTTTTTPYFQPHSTSLKLKIPTSPLFKTNSISSGSSSPSSISSSNSRIESPGRSTSYTDLTPLPSPLIPTDSTAAIFKAFNGQSPPSSAISRAPSMRSSGLRFGLRQTKQNTVAAAITNKPSSAYSPVLTGVKMDEDGIISSFNLSESPSNSTEHYQSNSISVTTHSNTSLISKGDNNKDLSSTKQTNGDENALKFDHHLKNKTTTAVHNNFSQETQNLHQELSQNGRTPDPSTPSLISISSQQPLSYTSSSNSNTVLNTNVTEAHPNLSSVSVPTLNQSDQGSLHQLAPNSSMSAQPLPKPSQRKRATNPRSISEYTPQPIVPLAFSSYRKLSNLSTEIKNLDKDKDGDIVLKDRLDEDSIFEETINNHNFPLPPLIHVEKRESSTENPSNETLQDIPGTSSLKSETSVVSSIQSTKSCDTNTQHDDKETAPKIIFSANVSGATTSGILSPNSKIQPRSASSGSPAHGTPIQREKPAGSSRLLKVDSSSSLNTHTASNFQSQPYTSDTLVEGKVKPPRCTDRPEVSSVSCSTPHQNNDQNDYRIFHPEQTPNSVNTLNPVTITHPATITIPSDVSQDKTTIPSPQESTASAATASTSSGSISSSASIATASSVITSATSAVSNDKIYSEQVFEAYDSNMKKSTWNEIKQLGQGAFSRVILACPAERYIMPEYLGRRNEFRVAIKVVDIQIDGGHAHSRERMESGLKREIEILKVVKHPSLIQMYAFNIDHESAMMVLPLCPGGDLFDLIIKHRKEMKCALVRRIFGEVCRAVAYLHSKFVVHRDIKLENVLLNIPIEKLLQLDNIESHPTALATLTDMGLSRQITPENPSLSTRCGSVDYVPPELLMGQTYDGRQTDSWALGVLLYAMIEGRLPFDPQVYHGRQVRGKVAHRIARVEWSWVYFRDHKDTGDAYWEGGMELVEGALQKRDKRLLAMDMVNHPWVKGSAPETLESPWIKDISHIFKE